MRRLRYVGLVVSEQQFGKEGQTVGLAFFVIEVFENYHRPYCLIDPVLVESHDSTHLG